MNLAVPKQLNYADVLPVAIESRSNKRTFEPTNGTKFSPSGTNVIRLNLNYDNLADFTHSYLHRTGAARARGVGGARLLHAAPWACYVTVNHGSAPGARASAGGRDARNHVVVGPGLPAERPAGWRCCLGALAATIPPGRGAGPAASPPLRHRVRKPPAGPATAQVCSAPDHQEWPAAFAGAAARHWGRAVARRRDPERSEPVSGVSSELKSDVLMPI